MRAVIMAGGKGVRLQPYTKVLPKPMLPLGDRPILAWLLDDLAAAGVTDVTLAVHYLGYVFRAYFGNGRQHGLRIRYKTEKEPLGTAGPLRWCREWEEPFLVTNADIVTDLDFADLYRFHQEQDAWLTVATQLATTRSLMGVLETQGVDVVAYHEKPSRLECIGLGIYVVDPRALPCLPADGRCDMPDLIRVLLADGHRVVHYQTDALWFDLGSPAEYESVASRWPDLQKAIRGEGP